jgi:hypothetical protein
MRQKEHAFFHAQAFCVAESMAGVGDGGSCLAR